MSRRDQARPFDRRDAIGPVLCCLGAVCMLAGLSVDLGSTASKILMVAAAVLFVPGAFVTLTLVRHVAGPPN